ncbi:hypothetical protein CCR75_002835 [Bremia lactucae]|uniref:RRM domain-containing protein n=1 Tax=Bremia lactucae TaxID=4779 RepID=A0A976FR72_BRELC|nr:hypothetical protein CCR75_009688 [Bremia lactucae]TDH71245.1 hypothetical protein CCR75_002835 [Bremia lactucae]
MGRRSTSPRRSRSRSPRRARPRSRSSSRGGRRSIPLKRSRSHSRVNYSRTRARSRSPDRQRDRSRGRNRRGRSRSVGRVRSEPISLLVRNLAPDISQDELRQAFSRHAGDILDVYIPKEYSSNRPRGFAFIEFADARVGRDVKLEMDRTQLGGREIAVLFAKQHRKSPQEMRRILHQPNEGSPKRSFQRRSKSRSRSSERRSASPNERSLASPRRASFSSKQRNLRPNSDMCLRSRGKESAMDTEQNRQRELPDKYGDAANK